MMPDHEIDLVVAVDLEREHLARAVFSGAVGRHTRPFCPGQWAPRRHEAWCGENVGRARKADQGGYVMMTMALYRCHGHDGEGDDVSQKGQHGHH